jgi:hypothetical protein
MDKQGAITEHTPDVENKLRDKRAADDPTSKIRALDDDVTKRMSEQAAKNLTTPK